jgi:transposase InsO family protein
MKRRRSLKRIDQDQKHLIKIQTVKKEHPLWGYRSVWAYLNNRKHYKIGKNCVQRLMQENNLTVKPNDRLKAKRGNLRRKPRADRPNQFWGIDMTKIKLATWGWFYLTIVLDWYTKEIVGYSLSIQSKTDDWLDALEMAINNRFPNGIRDTIDKKELYLISDNGCQPTSSRFRINCSLAGIKQIFTTWSNPKGNADTERVMRRIKEDFIWINEWDSPFDLQDDLKTWINDYNTDFPHQSLMFATPEEFYKNWINKELELNLPKKILA